MTFRDKPTRTGQTRTGRIFAAEEAQRLGALGLNFLAAEPDRLERFLAVTGLDAAAIRAQISDAGFLYGVLDYLLSDEALLQDFCTRAGIAPETVAPLRHVLAGHEW